MTTASDRTALRRRRVLLVLGAVALGAVLAFVFWPRPPVLPPLPTHDDRAVAEAYAAARQPVLDQPQSAEAWGRLGMTLFANGDSAAAVPFLAEAERLDAADHRWPYLQAVILLQGQPAAALAKARRAQEAAPHQVNIHIMAGEIAFLQGQFAEAEAAFQQALRCDPDNPYALLGMARWHADQQRLAECRALLGGIVGHGAVAKAAHALLAEVLDRAGQPDAARDTLRRAQRLPEDPPRGDRVMDDVQQCLAGLKALNKRAEHLQKQGKLSEAIAVQKQAAQEYPNQVTAHFLLGKMYAQRALTQRDPAARQRDLAAADNALQAALRLAPDNMRVKFYLGLAYFEQRSQPGARAQAIAHFRGVLARQPDDSMATEYLGDCLMLQGAWQEAANAFRKLVQLRPDLAEARAALADALEHQGDWAAALTARLNAIQLDSANVSNQTRLLLAIRRICPR